MSQIKKSEPSTRQKAELRAIHMVRDSVARSSGPARHGALVILVLIVHVEGDVLTSTRT